MRKDIFAASRLLHKKIRVISVDYEAVLSLASSKDVIYMDPPYQGICNTRDSRYISGLEQNRFIKVLHQLNERDISYIVSYDGRSGTKIYGEELPDSLQLQRLELEAGRSSQATLLGRKIKTIESLYLSPALLYRLKLPQNQTTKQLTLFGESA